MNSSRCIGYAVVVGMFVGWLVGCVAHDPVYDEWGEVLKDAPARATTINDISLLLGSPPTQCHDLEPIPTLGVTLDDWAYVISLWPAGPAAKAGIQKDDRILKIGEIEVSNNEEAIKAFASVARFDQPVTVTTKRGVHTVVSRKPNEAKQCYWDIAGGVVGKSAGFGYANSYGGSVGQSGSIRNRFFRTACQFYDGKTVRCSSNWQR